MQENLNRLCEWAMKWKINFNAAKCEVIHYGRRNEHHEYWMNGLRREIPGCMGGGYNEANEAMFDGGKFGKLGTRTAE